MKSGSKVSQRNIVGDLTLYLSSGNIACIFMRMHLLTPNSVAVISVIVVKMKVEVTVLYVIM